MMQKMKTQVRIALLQTHNVYDSMPPSTYDLYSLRPRIDSIRRVNINHNLTLISKAKALGADIVCLGELFSLPYFPRSKSSVWFDCAEDAQNGPSITAIRQAAASNQLIIIAPIYEYDARTTKRYDTAVIVDQNGAVLGLYRKIHIPDGRNEDGHFSELYYFCPSDGNIGWNSANSNISKSIYFPVFSTRFANIGLMLCYDRHFEGVVSTLTSQGAEIIFCPSATFGRQSRRAWGLEFETDAIRNNVYIAGLNRNGVELPWNTNFYGDSYITGPYGRVTNTSLHPEIILSDIDMDLLKKPHKSGWNISRDRRSDILASRELVGNFP